MSLSTSGNPLRARSNTDSIPLAPTAYKLEQWQGVSSGEVVSAEDFLLIKKEQGLYLVNISGDQDALPVLKGEQSQTQRGQRCAQVAISNVLERLQDSYGDRVVVVTTGLTTGVPGLADREAQRLGIRTLGVVSDQDHGASLNAEVNYLVPGGIYRGDSVETSVQLCDEFVLIGGGGIERMQILAGAIEQKTVNIVLGFDGASNSFRAEDFPAGGIVAYHNPTLHH